MKTHCKPLATALAATLQIAALAAVPLAWDVRPGQPAPVMFDRYHGETLSFSATFRGFGELPFSPGADIRLWYQTNGMGRAWWSVPATVQSNVLSATWSPALDPGADRVSLFFGAPSNAFASAVLRLRPSPGFFPNVLNPPPTLVDLESGLAAFCATGTAFRAATIGTETRWVDVTGCVWEVSLGYSDWSIVYPDPDNAYYDVHLEASGQGDGEYWVPYVGEAVSGIAKGSADSTYLVWDDEAIANFSATRTVEWHTNLVARALSTDTTQTTEPSVLLNAPALASARIVPDTRPSAYWPNRQRVLKLGDGETVVSADRAEANWLLVRDPTRLLFIDTVTVENGVTNYTFKTFQQYLNSVSPDTLRDVMRGYLPVEGGGTVTGAVTVAGDVTVTGTLAAPSLLRVVTADIEANGFSVSNGVLRANSGLVVSNGMCKINCARATIGIGTPRLHIEGNQANVARNLTFGGDWDAPYFTFHGLMTNEVDVLIRNYGLIDVSNATAIAAMPVVVPDYRTAGSRRIVVLENGRLNLVGDSLYGATMVLQCPNAGTVNTRFDVLLDFSSAVPYIILDAGTWGELPVFLGQTDALEPSAGTPRIVHFRCIGDDRWIVTYDDLTSWMPPTNAQVEEEP